MTPASVLKESTSYWKSQLAHKLAFLVDAEQYYRALYESLIQAKHCILITGWDVSSRVDLVKDVNPPYPPQLGALLFALATERPLLEIYVLCWNFPILYAPDREPAPRFNPGWKTHPRIHLHLDDQHPIGACHHQKVVVVDECVAFSGGLDVCNRRWDTSAHSPDNPLRVDASGHPYGPFHDVQMAVEGPVAATLGELIRKRWHRSTGEHLKTAPLPAKAPWPAMLPSELSDIPVAISLTQAAYRNYPESRQIENLYLAAIRSAQNYIYFENQYLTCDSIGRALIESLRQESGPEIILVLPQKSIAWLEEFTMGLLQNRLMRKIKAHDKFNRLGVFYPYQKRLGKLRITVHSKIMIVDDEFVKVGSANMNNRSMGLDTECDLSVEARGDKAVQKVFAQFRNRLMAEHMGIDAAALEREIETRKSLLQTIGAHQHADRCLKTLKRRTPSWLKPMVAHAQLFDPDAPLARETLVDTFVLEDPYPRLRKPILQSLISVAAAVGYIGLWLKVDVFSLRAFIFQHPFFFSGIFSSAYLMGGIFLAPPLLMNLATLSLLGPGLGFIVSLGGTLFSAIITYFLGRLLPRSWVKRLVGKRLNSLGRKLAKMGTLPSTLLRILPVAPLTVLNLVSGADQVPTRSFLRASALSLIPVLLILAGMQKTFEFLVRWQGQHFAVQLLIVLIVAITILMYAPYHKARRRQA